MEGTVGKNHVSKNRLFRKVNCLELQRSKIRILEYFFFAKSARYFGTMPMAVYTFSESYDFAGKTIHPFCTHEGSGLGGTESDIKKTAKR